MKIGTMEFDRPVMLAPMAGVTDLPYRLICKEMGCDYMVTEMVSAKAVLYNNKNTDILLQTLPEEAPSALQLFGSDPEIMADIALRLEPLGFAAFDINMGCPVPKIVNNGEGSSLMKNPSLAGKIVSTMVKKITKPVTVKFRKGFDDEHVNALKMFHYTGCDGIAVGRGAKGNPWLFREIKAAIHGDVIPARPSLTEIKDMIKKHATLMTEYKPEYMVVREMRKHVSWYTTGLHNCAALRDEVNHTETLQELFSLLDKRMIDK